MIIINALVVFGQLLIVKKIRKFPQHIFVQIFLLWDLISNVYMIG